MTLLAIDWPGTGIKTLQLILSLSILVTLHELGHYLTARWFKCRVEKFYLFFDPWFSLWKKKIGETEYGIGWVPLGGYVKISGMIDESMDKEATGMHLGTVFMLLGCLFGGRVCLSGYRLVPLDGQPQALHQG